jgi:hypothetical protein
MGKRFTATEKWNDGWFLGLSKENKLIWCYILDTCTNGGRWIKNFKMLNFCCDSNITEKDFKGIFDGRIIGFDGFFFIPKFLRFQYPKGLNSLKPAIISVRNEVLQYNLLPIIKQSLGNDYLIIKDKDTDKDKDKDKDKEKEKDKEKDNIDFEQIWSKYPNKVGRKAAQRHFEVSIKTSEDFIKIKTALKNYLESDRVKKGFIQNGSTWFNDWQGWLEVKTQSILDKYEVHK